MAGRQDAAPNEDWVLM